MTTPVKVVLVGSGGYGRFYLRQLLSPAAAGRIAFAGVVDPIPDLDSPLLAQMQAGGGVIYPDLEQFYAQAAAELVIIASPIHLHARQTLLALSHGSHVLCEKPLCATVAAGREVIQAGQAAGRFVAVGYQWSFSEAIQRLKADIIAGRLGRPQRFKACIFWPRWRPYYQRNQWAGKIRLGDGSWVFDSPVNNATAHYLHNLLYLLGDRPESSARPVSVQAELYRANEIENYDTAALRCRTDQGVEILFYTAHPVATTRNPIFHLTFERAEVDYQADGAGRILATLADGRTHDYGDPFADDAGKLWQAVEAVRSGATLPCGAEAALAQTICMTGAQQSPTEITNFPADLIREEGERGWVEGLTDILTDCYERHLLPAERGDLAWARAGAVVALGD